MVIVVLVQPLGLKTRGCPVSIENNIALALADGLTVEVNPAADCRPDSGKAFESGPRIDPTSAAGSDARLRLEQAARRDFQFIWRCIRRFGIQSNHAVDDAVQRVFEVAAARASTSKPVMNAHFYSKQQSW